MSSISHPRHYNSGKIEVIEFIEDQGFGSGFCRGNAIKYIARAGKKDPGKEIEDLEKAAWYIKREIEILKAVREKREAIRPNDMNPRQEEKLWKAICDCGNTYWSDGVVTKCNSCTSATAASNFANGSSRADIAIDANDRVCLNCNRRAGEHYPKAGAPDRCNLTEITSTFLHKSGQFRKRMM